MRVVFIGVVNIGTCANKGGKHRGKGGRGFHAGKWALVKPIKMDPR